MQTVAEAPNNELWDLSISEVRGLLETKKVSPVELTEASLARIAAVNDKLHAFITVTPDTARSHAKLSEQRFMKGQPLSEFDGIPFALKDNIETAGIRSTSHSKLLIDNIPTEDATVAAKLNAAGGILLHGGSGLRRRALRQHARR